LALEAYRSLGERSVMLNQQQEEKQEQFFHISFSIFNKPGGSILKNPMSCRIYFGISHTSIQHTILQRCKGVHIADVNILWDAEINRHDMLFLSFGRLLYVSHAIKPSIYLKAISLSINLKIVDFDDLFFEK